MIVLDTHAWIWWVHADPRLSSEKLEFLTAHEEEGLGVSVMSCWEVAKLTELNRLDLDVPVPDWLDLALAYPGVQLLSLTPEIAVESTCLPGDFHKDPADQILTATARICGVPLATQDRRILDYPHVETINLRG